MIRFSCATCNHQLRAPADLAGKKGKCARCGAVNLVPEALSVEVSRAAGPSPFRSTADLQDKPIETIIESDSMSVLGTDQPATTIPQRSSEFFEQVLPRLGDLIEDIDGTDSAPAQPVEVARIGVAETALQNATAPALPPILPFDPTHSEASRRAILGALVVGMVLGFCLGVIAARWVW